MPTDPICGMTVDPERPAGQHQHNGQKSLSKRLSAADTDFDRSDIFNAVIDEGA